jgi:hypothetical protein
MSDSNEINIPEPVNKPPQEEQKTKVKHPESKVNTTNKIGTPVKNKRAGSRFEPAPVSVEVPSHGFLYQGITNDEEVAKGVLRVKPITMREEEILTTDRLVQQGKALDMVLENCIKSDIDPYDLLSSDRLYILFYLRGMTFGLEYDFDIRCYHCGYNFVQTVEIDKLPIKEWENKKEAEEPVKIELPISGATIEAHYMRGHEERELTKVEQESRTFDQPDSSSSRTLLMLIDKVTMPDEEVLSPQDKEDFISNMVGSDIDYFRETLNENSPGIKQLENIKCPRCDGWLEFNVPLGRNFFRRSRPRQK